MPPTALGEVTNYSAGSTKSICLLPPTTAPNGPPTDAGAGLEVAAISALWQGRLSVELGLLLYSTAGSGVMTAKGRLWSYHPGPADWFPLGTGADGTKGVVNATNQIGETSADKIRHQETLALPGLVGTRIYFEITEALGGTGTSVTVELVARDGYPALGGTR